MLNQPLKDFVVDRLLPRVQTPAQYIGGEWNAVGQGPPPAARQALPRLSRRLLDRHEPPRAAGALRRDEPPRRLGLRAGVSRRWPTWSSCSASTGCRFTAWKRSRRLPRSTCSASRCNTTSATATCLTMLDLGGIPLAAEERTAEHPLVIAGGPCAVNPEPMARFIDLFVIGDGEEALPEVCDLWLRVEAGRAAIAETMSGRDGRPAALRLRAAVLRAARHDGRRAADRRFGRSAATCPTRIEPAVVADLDADSAAARPRSCRTSSACRTGSPSRSCAAVRASAASARARRSSGRCGSARSRRSCRRRMEQYRNTGYNEISLLSLSTSDYPEFDELMRRLQETFRPLGVSRLAAQPADQRAIAAGRRSAEHRPPLGPDPGARGRPRRHAPADRQADHQRRPVRRLPPGVRERFFAGEAVFHVRPARRAGDRPGRDHRDVGDDLAAGPGGQRPAGRRWWPTCRTSCPSRRRPTSGTPCSGASIFAGAHEFLHRRKRLRSVQLRATTWRRACWRA